MHDFTHKIICKSENELEAIAEQLINSFSDKKIFAFQGELGAGKTTFIKSICKFLGVIENMTSPSYSIVNEYLTVDEESIYHFDFYRIKSIEEVYDIGYEDYFFSGNYCFLEWPEKIEKLLPENIVYVCIEEAENKIERIISF
ncbi:MAG: tRNA (adenosine(37)-N6)-threonylcarbamoyltransferase complex ATPase subunit type 1 TsaE [Saprospiraceae bacterium]|nr:tRNA (adenosine(37)-N6)-threonylcarbamoyltransferase complex ATPase subunit type 1 TsaE [Saprospiraceae bacterium]